MANGPDKKGKHPLRKLWDTIRGGTTFHLPEDPVDVAKTAYTYADELALGALPNWKPKSGGLAGIAAAGAMVTPGPNWAKMAKGAIKNAPDVFNATRNLANKVIHEFGDQVWHSPGNIVKTEGMPHGVPSRLWSRNIDEAADELWPHEAEPGALVSAFLSPRGKDAMMLQGSGRSLQSMLASGATRPDRIRLRRHGGSGILYRGMKSDFGDELGDVLYDPRMGFKRDLLSDIKDPGWYYSNTRNRDVRGSVNFGIRTKAENAITKAMNQMTEHEKRALGIFPRRHRRGR